MTSYRFLLASCLLATACQVETGGAPAAAAPPPDPPPDPSPAARLTPDRSELVRSVDAVRGSLVALDLASSAAGAGEPGQLRCPPPTETYNPWEMDDAVEGTVLNPLFVSGTKGTNPLYTGSATSCENPTFETSTVLRLVRDDLASLSLDVRPEALAAVRDRAQLWQVFFAAVGATAPPKDDYFSAVTTPISARNVAWSFAELRCVAATLANEAVTSQKSDAAALDAACRGYPSLVVIGHGATTSAQVLATIEAEVHAVDAALAETRVALVAFKGAVESAFGAGAALDDASAAVSALDAYGSSYHGAERKALVEALQGEPPDGTALEARVRAVTLSKDPVTFGGDDTAATQGAYAALLAKGAGIGPCGEQGLTCAISELSSVRTFNAEAFIAYDEAFSRAMSANDKGELRDVRTSALDARGKLVAQLLRSQAKATAAEADLARIAAILKTRHETAKNAISNLR